MRHYTPGMINQFKVYEDGKVVLPKDKQQALYLLAMDVGHWSDPVTDIPGLDIVPATQDLSGAEVAPMVAVRIQSTPS